MPVLTATVFNDETKRPIEWMCSVQNAVDEPAFFQLKYLLGKGLAFVFCDWHSDFSIGGNILSGLRRTLPPECKVSTGSGVNTMLMLVEMPHFRCRVFWK